MKKRQSLRIPNFDYSLPGYYFITCVTQDRKCLLGSVENCLFCPSVSGNIVQKTWENLIFHYPNIDLDSFTLMPNHIHGIIILKDGKNPDKKQHGIPEIVRAFKSFSSRRINELQNSPGTK
ncbi:MAG TPA: transposase, partial [Anaerolineaceae bacterium]|nr:transposase [Anaerolineaceae bacterium]